MASDRNLPPSSRPTVVPPPGGPAGVTARLVSLGLVVAIAAIALQTAAHVANALVFEGRYDALDVTRDTNAFAWMSSVATFASGFAAAIAATCFPEWRRRLGVLAALLVFLSLDDLIQAHERLEHLTDGTAGVLAEAGQLVFLVLYLPLLGGALVLLVGAARRAPRRAGRSIAAGLALLAGSVGIRVAGAGVAIAGASVPEWAKVAATTATQDAELGGWILVAGGLTATLCYLLLSTTAAPEHRG